jgi:hypothetical protein
MSDIFNGTNNLIWFFRAGFYAQKGFELIRKVNNFLEDHPVSSNLGFF